MESNLNLDRHISGKFNEDLERVKTKLLEMGGLVERQISDSITALLEGNTSLAQTVRDTDRSINAMEMDIDAECATIFARRQPIASDLRMLLASIKSISDMERMGDEAKHIAGFAISAVEKGEPTHGYRAAKDIGERVRRMTRNTFDAFARFDIDLALSVVNEDHEVDRIYREATRELLSEIADNPKNLNREMNMVWTLRSMERIGDHCINICEYVIYMVEGEDVRHTDMEKLVEQRRDHTDGD